MPVEESYVRLKPGIPVTMRFDDAKFITKEVVDPVLGWKKNVKSLAFHVVELNGAAVSTVFSLVSQKAMNEFEPFLERDRYKRYRFTIIRDAGAWTAPRIVSAEPI